MKKIELICVGKIKEPFLRDAIAEYQKRLTKFCQLSIIELKDEGDNAAIAIAKESAAISLKMNIDGGRAMRTPMCSPTNPVGARIARPQTYSNNNANIVHGNIISILLDIQGEQITSPALADYIDKAFTNGATKLQFIVGGSHGVDNTIKTAASKKISFGRITYPHQLIRVVALEQIYRAMCIQNNVPYHK